MKTRVGAIIFLLVGGIVGCSGGTGDSSSGYTPSSSTSPPPNAPTAPVATATNPLTLQMYTVYDSTNYAYNLNFVESGTTICAATTNTPDVTCHLQIPEGRLFFSSLTFQFSWNTANCKLLTFQPYYYQQSNSTTFIAPGSAPGTAGIDCSGTVTTPSSTCYGGAAPHMISNFPQYASVIYLPDESIATGPQSKTLVLPSAFSTHSDDPVAPGATSYTASNRQAANDLNSADWGNSYTAAQLGNIGDTLVAHTYVNYTWICHDDWYDPQTYAIHLFITDVNTNGDAPNTGQDDFVTWDEL